MTTATVPTELMDKVMALPPDARRELAEQALASLHTPAPLSPEWKAEIARRVKAEEAGQMPYYTPDEVDAYLAQVDAESRGP